MKGAAILLALLCVSAARADEAPQLGDRLIDIALSGCEYLHAHGFADPKVVWPAPQLAAHFGRVLRKVPFGATQDFYLAVPSFSDWKVIYESRIVTFYLPTSVVLRMSELVKRLGTPSAPDVDHGWNPNASDGSKRTDTDWVFPKNPARRACWIRAKTDGSSDDLRAQRVLSFSFQD